MRHAALALVAVIVLATPALAAGRPTGILLNYEDANGKVTPALFSIPGHDMPMAECRSAIREQVKIFRAQMKNDDVFGKLTYAGSKCVYLDTNPLGTAN